jgi:hypothetical protein
MLNRRLRNCFFFRLRFFYLLLNPYRYGQSNQASATYPTQKPDKGGGKSHGATHLKRWMRSAPENYQAVNETGNNPCHGALFHISPPTHSLIAQELSHEQDSEDGTISRRKPGNLLELAKKDVFFS